MTVGSARSDGSLDLESVSSTFFQIFIEYHIVMCINDVRYLKRLNNLDFYCGPIIL